MPYILLLYKYVGIKDTNIVNVDSYLQCTLTLNVRICI